MNATTPAPALQTGNRLHYMDNLRALAMLAGVVFHAALAYSPMLHSLFPTADRQNSLVVDIAAWFVHLFRMPLFFVVAGFFAAMLVQRRGLGGMFRNRLLRVALPFVVLWPLVNFALTTSTLHAAETAQHPSPLLALIKTFLDTNGLPEQLPGTGHLWFLYYLMFFYVLIWAARNFNVGALIARFFPLQPVWQLAMFPLLLIPALASVTAPFPAPESFFPQFWAFGFFGPFFAFGYQLQKNPQLIERYRPFVPWLFVGSAFLYTGVLFLFDRISNVSAIKPWLLALLEAPISVWMTVVCLCMGRSLLNARHGVLRYFADASYWTYIVHLPVLFAIQYRLMDLELAWQIKFALSLLLTMAVCLVSYQLIVRPSILAKFFGGQIKVPVKMTAAQ